MLRAEQSELKVKLGVVEQKAADLEATNGQLVTKLEPLLIQLQSARCQSSDKSEALEDTRERLSSVTAKHAAEIKALNESQAQVFLLREKLASAELALEDKDGLITQLQDEMERTTNRNNENHLWRKAIAGLVPQGSLEQTIIDGTWSPATSSGCPSVHDENGSGDYPPSPKPSRTMGTDPMSPKHQKHVESDTLKLLSILREHQSAAAGDETETCSVEADPVIGKSARASPHLAKAKAGLGEADQEIEFAREVARLRTEAAQREAQHAVALANLTMHVLDKASPTSEVPEDTEKAAPKHQNQKVEQTPTKQ